MIDLLALAGFCAIFILCLYFFEKKFKGIFVLFFNGIKERFARLDLAAFKHKIKYYVFLVRWFVIGKYHCDFKHKITKKAFAFLHKSFWCFVIFSCTFTFAAALHLLGVFE